MRLSLETLGRFNFTPIPVLEFTRDHVLPWLDDPDTSVRKAATLAAAHILNRHVYKDNKRPTPNPVHSKTTKGFMLGQARASRRFALCSMNVY